MRCRCSISSTNRATSSLRTIGSNGSPIPSGLRPVLEQVAEERKLAIILEKNDTVQFSEPSSDITDAIIDTARRTLRS